MTGPKGKYAWSATVGEKGQIVIPRQARELFGIKPGDTLIILGDEERGLAIPPRSLIKGLADAIFDAEKAGEEE
jgi:AbrB family looped-hinge helix DNA binding protein